MRMPRDLSVEELAALLRRQYGYRLVRQRGSHMTLGTTIGVVADIATHLDKSRDEVRAELFGT